MTHLQLTREVLQCGVEVEGQIWPPDRYGHQLYRLANIFSSIELCSELCSFKNLPLE